MKATATMPMFQAQCMAAMAPSKAAARKANAHTSNVKIAIPWVTPWATSGTCSTFTRNIHASRVNSFGTSRTRDYSPPAVQAMNIGPTAVISAIAPMMVTSVSTVSYTPTGATHPKRTIPRKYTNHSSSTLSTARPPRSYTRTRWPSYRALSMT